MTRHEAGNLGAAHRMADERDLTEIEMIEKGCKVPGERIEIIAASGVIGATVTPPVIGDAAEALIRQRKHLILPHLAAQAPTGEKHHRRSAAPFLVVQTGAIIRF